MNLEWFWFEIVQGTSPDPYCSWSLPLFSPLFEPAEAGGYKGEFDTLFSAAFAQTLAFGLLLVREATNNPVGPDAWQEQMQCPGDRYLVWHIPESYGCRCRPELLLAIHRVGS
jgi:hypothetical protein